jgi:hypothetical protein
MQSFNTQEAIEIENPQELKDERRSRQFDKKDKGKRDAKIMEMTKIMRNRIRRKSEDKQRDNE